MTESRRREALAAAGALVAARLAHLLLAPPNSDEAYYWLWGAHPALSYYDHPPLHAWVQGAVRAALGTSLVTLRLAPTLSTAGSAWLLARLVRRATPRLDAGEVRVAVLAAFAAPLLLVFTGFAWMDHLLVLLGLAALDRFAAFYADVASGGRGRTATLLLGALALGLAALAKYNALFLGLAVASVAAWEPRLRRLWREPRFWGAAALALAVLAPVFAWNARHGWASFRYNLVDRHQGGAGAALAVSGVVRFLAPWIATASPFLLAAAWPRLRTPAAEPGVEVLRKLALAGSAVTLGALSLVGLRSTALYYWAIPALLVLAPFAGALLDRPRLLSAHLAYAAVVAVGLAVHAAVVPLTALLPGVEDDESRNPWGWGEIAAAVEAERARMPGAFAAASDYRTGAALGFALLARGLPPAEAEVMVRSSRRSAFDDWRDDARLAGRSAVLVTDRQARMNPWIAAPFGEVERAREVEVSRLGVALKPWELWACRRYRGAGSR